MVVESKGEGRSLKYMNELFEHVNVQQIRLHVLPTDRFKTYSVSVYMGQELAESTVTPIALIPFVLRRGTRRYPQTQRFRERQDDLYGAGFGYDIYKRGDHQIVQFRMDMIHDRFVSNSQSLLTEALRFIGDAITDPALEQGHFIESYVAAEKETVRKRIEAIQNDKGRYAAERCIEEMCKNEPYRLHPLGRIDDLNKITADSLYDAYLHFVQTAPIDIYVVGQTSTEEVGKLIDEMFPVSRIQTTEYKHQLEHPAVDEINEVTERMQINQGKLNLGLRTYTTFADQDYPALLMYNGILGGYAHSKLFVNVREKHSLAYTASSRLDGHKGLLTIHSGIEFSNYEKAVSIIKKQLEAMETGEISDLELKQTKAMIANQLRESQDSAYEMIAYDFNHVLSGKHRTIEELVNQLEHTQVTDIRQIASKIKLDTIYFLQNQEMEVKV